MFSVDDVKLYPKSECIDAKELLKKYNSNCMPYINSKSIGSMNHIYDRFKPVDAEDYYRYWTDMSYYEGITNPSERGRDKQYLYELSLKYCNSCGNVVDPLMCYKDILMHAIYQTLDGREMEVEAANALISAGYEPYHSDHTEDSDLNIDFLVRKNGTLRFLLQVKPISTFMNNKDWALKTRSMFFKKQQKGYEQYGVPYYYLIYNNHNYRYSTWVKNDARGKMMFTLEELCNDDGTMKVRIYENSEVPSLLDEISKKTLLNGKNFLNNIKSFFKLEKM